MSLYISKRIWIKFNRFVTMGALRVAYVISIDQKVVDQGRVNNRLLAADVIKFNQEYVDLEKDNFIMSLCSKIIY